MKRRSHTATNQPSKPSKTQTKTPSTSAHKKRNNKSHNEKNTKPRKKEIEDYIIIDGTVYSADTKTQRYEVDQFVSRLRSEAKIYKPRSAKKVVEEQLES